MVSSFQGGSFRPTEQLDITPTLDYNFSQQNRSLQNYHESLRANDRTLSETAGKQMEQLAELSKSASSFLGQVKERRDKRLEARANMWYLKNGLPQEQIDSYLNARKGIKNEFNDIVKITSEDDKMDHFTKKQFMDLTPELQIRIFEREVAQRGQQYVLEGNAELDASLDPADYMAARNVLDEQFLEQFNGMNEVMLEENVFKHMREVQKAHYDNWHKERGEAMEKERIDGYNTDATGAFISGQGGAVDYITTLTAEYKGDRGKARDEFYDNREEDIANGLGSFATIEAIGEEMIDGKKLKNHHAHKGRYNKLIQELSKYQKDEFNRREASKKVAAGLAENAAIDALGDTPDEATVKTYIRALRKTHKGHKFEKLKKILSDSTIEATQLDIMRDEIKAWANRRLLTNDRLKQFPWQLQREFADVAKMQTQEAGDNKVMLGAVEQLVLSNSQTFVNGKAKHPTAMILAARMQSVYMDRLNFFMNEGDIDHNKASELAYQATAAEFKKYKKNPYGKGWNIGLPKAKELSNTFNTITEQRKERTASLKADKLQTLTVKGLWGTEEDLVKDIKGLKEGKIPAWTKQITKLYPDLDEIDVINMYAETMNPNLKVEHPLSYKILKDYSNKNPKTQAALNKHKENPTPETAAGAFNEFESEDRYNVFYDEETKTYLTDIATSAFEGDLDLTGTLYDFLKSDSLIQSFYNLPPKQFTAAASRRRSKANPISPPDIDTPIREAISSLGETAMTLDQTLFDASTGWVDAMFRSLNNSIKAKQASDQEKRDEGWTKDRKGRWIPPKTEGPEYPLMDLTYDQLQNLELIQFKFGKSFIE